MRLLRLDAARVGHWEVPVQLPLSPRVTVVLGDNEAGKSTLQRALHALLFGTRRALVAPLSEAAFDMAAQVRFQGATHEIRRQGRKFANAPDAPLAGLLDESRASRFQDLFCLSHDNLLPEQPASFLGPEGVVGSLLFAVHTGLSPLQLKNARGSAATLLKTMNSAAKASDGFPHYKQRYQQARAADEDVTRFSGRDRVSFEVTKWSAEVHSHEARLKELESEAGHLKTILDEADTSAQLDDARRQLQAFGENGAALTSARVEALRHLWKQREDRREAAEEQQAELARIEADHAAAEVENGLHVLASQRDGLRDLVSDLKAEYGALADQQRQRNEEIGEIADLLARFGTHEGDSVENVAQTLLRPETKIVQLQALLKRRDTLQADKHTKHTLASAARDALGELEARYPPDAAAPDLTRLEDAQRLLSDAVATEEQLEQLRGELADTAAELRDRCSELRFGDAPHDPTRLAVPDRRAAEACERQLAEARAALHSCEHDWRTAERRARESESRLARQREKLGDVPDTAALAKARAVRDEQLHALGRDGVSNADERRHQAEALRQLVHHADVLADQRMAAGEALGQLAEAEQQHAQACESRDAAEQLRSAAQTEVARCEKALADVWQMLEAPPASAAAWFEAHDRWQRVWQQHAAREGDVQRLEARLETDRRDASRLLADVLPALAELGSLTRMRDGVGEARKKALADARDLDLWQQQRQAAQTNQRSADSALADADAAMKAWQTQWESAIADLPDTLDGDPAAVEHWIGMQNRLRDHNARLQRLSGQLERRQIGIAEKERHVQKLLDAMHEQEPGIVVPAGLALVDAYQWADQLISHSVRCQSVRQALARERDKARIALEQARLSLDAADAELAGHWAVSGADGKCNAEQLDVLARQAEQVEQIRRTIDQLHTTLTVRWGDRMEQCRIRLAEDGRQVLGAQLRELQEEIAQRQQWHREASDRRRDVQAELESLHREHNAQALAQDLADAREAVFDKADEWLRLNLATLILDRAYRQASDGGQTLEELASTYFSTLVDGAYSGLRIDHDDPENPQLLAIERGREEKSLEQLSTGTRDQLWLALRLAAIVAAAKETPFPLLLDDSLVQFDNRRSRAALRLLHQLSEHVQVILFTHHEHVADLAEEVIPASDASVLVLPRPDGSVARRTPRGGPPENVDQDFG